MRCAAFLIVFSIFAAGCSRDEIVEGLVIDTGVIMPLATGNAWDYYTEYYDTAKVADSARGLFITIDRDTVINDERWYIPLMSGESVLLYANREDGFWVWEQGETPGLAVKFPAEKGDSYFYGSVRITLVSTNYKVISFYGDLICYSYVEVDTTATADSVISYYAPGFGLARRELFGATDGGFPYLKQVWLLRDLRLN